MAISSINFQKTKRNSKAETKREFEAKYLLPEKDRLGNELWDCGTDEEDLFKQELESANRKGGRVPRVENSLWEGVLNLNKNHTMDDVQKVADHIAKKFNIHATRIAVHRDEGHFNIVSGEVEYNIHAHLNFMTYKDGKQNWRLELINKNKLRELQTEVAEILDMQRGKINSQSVRANHREFRQNAETIKASRKATQTLAKQKDLKQEIKELRAELKDHGATREDYAELEQLNKDLKQQIKEKNLTVEELQTALEYYKHREDDLQDQLQLEQVENAYLKEEVERLKTELAQIKIKANQNLGVVPNATREEISNLKKQIAEKDAEIEKMSNAGAKLVEMIESRDGEIKKLKEASSFSIQDKELTAKEKVIAIRDTFDTLEDFQKQFVYDLVKDRMNNMATGVSTNIKNKLR